MAARAHWFPPAPRPHRDLDGLRWCAKPRLLINEAGKVLVVVQQGDQPHGSRIQRNSGNKQPTSATGRRRYIAGLLSGPRSVATQLVIRGRRHSGRSANGAMLSAVPAPPAELASV